MPLNKPSNKPIASFYAPIFLECVVQLCNDKLGIAPPTNASFCLSVRWDISAQSDVLCELLNPVKLRIAHPKNADFCMRGRRALSTRSDVLAAELCKGKGALRAPGES